MEASGGADNKILVSQYTNLGIKYYEAKQTDLAAAAMEKAVVLDPNNANALKLLGSVRDAQGRKAEAITLLQKSLAVSKAAGQPPKENDYKFAAKLAYEAGFQPRGIGDFFRRQQQQVQLGETTERALAFLSTHPANADRLANLDKLAAALPARARSDFRSPADWKEIQRRARAIPPEVVEHDKKKEGE
jgi:tetratricopeptide (TPR) repeat protein